MPQTPITDLIKVNTTVAGAQFAPAVAALSGGGYIIVWQDFSGGRIFGQRFDAGGQKVGNELLLDSTQGGSPVWVSVAATANDGFVIAFQAGGFAQAEIFARTYDGANAPVGGLFAANTTSPNEQFNPHVATLDNGNLLFTWDTQAFNVFQEVRGRIFTAAGQALGNDFAIAPISATEQNGFSAITSLPGGGFVAIWLQAANSGTNFDIVGQRFTSGGAPDGARFTVNTQTTNNQSGNDVARLSDGSFVVSWTDPVPGNGGGRIVARHYDASGVAIGGEIVIDSKASGAYGQTNVTATANGGYVVSWTEDDGTSAQNNVLARQMAANDLPAGPVFEMSFNSPYGANYYIDGAVTLASGNVVFAWDGPSTNTSQDVYTRQYSFTTPSITPTGGDDVLSDTIGNDTINALGGNDYIDLTRGGNDSVNGGAGDDGFAFGAAFTAADTVDGGPGSNDQVGLQGDYAAGLTLGATTLANVEVVAVLPGFSYSLTTNDANVAAGQTLTFFGGTLGAGSSFTVNGADETDGKFRMYGGLGSDTFTGGALDDGFYFGPGKWGAGDSVVGGGGTNDQLALDGNYTVSIGASADVETLILLPGPAGAPNSFAVTLTDPWVANGATKTVWGVNVTTAMTIDGSAESNGNLIYFGGQGSDTLTGGAGADTISGGGGGDALRGNAGADVFRYDNPGDSTGSTDATRDRILDFGPGDRIDLSRIDAIAGGADDAFSFIGSAAFSGGGASAGQLRYTDAGGGIFIVEGDVNGDGIADFTLSLTMTAGGPPVATDFIL